MTALGLLKIYCIIVCLMYIGKFTLRNKLTLKTFFMGVIGSFLLYVLGWLFMITGKWVMLQVGITAANIVYIILYILLTLCSVLHGWD